MCYAFLSHSCTSKLKESNREQIILKLCMSASFFCFVLYIVSLHLSLSLSFLCLRGDKESWIRSKYVEKKFIQKLPETGRNPPLRRSSARRNRATTQDRTVQRPPIKPKPNRATLPRVTGKSGLINWNQWGFKGLRTPLVACLLSC